MEIFWVEVFRGKVFLISKWTLSKNRYKNTITKILQSNTCSNSTTETLEKDLKDVQSIILNNRKIAAKTVPFLNLLKWPGHVRSLANYLDIIDSIIMKFHNHTRIKMIKKKFRKVSKCSFQQVTFPTS